jgi:hypothetical protein
MKSVNALRNIIIRKSIHIFMAGAATLAVSGFWSATAPDASAAPLSFQWCEQSSNSSGTDYCIGAADFTSFDPVTETPTTGRLFFTPQSGTTDNFKLEFVGNTTQCVAANNNGTKVVIHPCNGAGVVWIPTDIDGSNGSELLESNEFPGSYLSGRANGTQFTLQSHKAPGYFQRFNTK